jgi:CRP/FNR family cyclic AMP-dependent transcriptional regulator
MDTSGFFSYPTEPSPPDASAPFAFLPDRSEDDWAVLLGYTETIRFRPGDTIVEAVATVGEAAFLDGRPRAVNVRALTHGELLRVSHEAFEALAARDPKLARLILADLGRILSARLRAAGDAAAGWTG